MIAMVVPARDVREGDFVVRHEKAGGMFLQSIARTIFGDMYVSDGLYFGAPSGGTYEWEGPDVHCGPDDLIVVMR